MYITFCHLSENRFELMREAFFTGKCLNIKVAGKLNKVKVVIFTKKMVSFKIFVLGGTSLGLKIKVIESRMPLKKIYGFFGFVLKWKNLNCYDQWICKYALALKVVFVQLFAR